MKTRIIGYFAAACAAAVQLGIAGNCAAADCCPAITPPNNNASLSIQGSWAISRDYSAANNPAYFAIGVNSGPPAVSPGNYLGWCIDANNDISAGPLTYGTLLFASCDPNLNSELFTTFPPSVYVDSATWHKINYLLNHKNGAYFWNIQVAIWNLIGGPIPPAWLLPPYPPTNPAEVSALLADAANNAAGWQLPCGGTVAVVAEIQNYPTPIQLVILEVPCKGTVTITCPSGGDLGCNPSYIPDCSVIQATAISTCDGPLPPTSIVCSIASDTVAGCQHTRVLHYVATDSKGNTASCDQTLTWKVDTTAPVLSGIPADLTLVCGSPVPVPPTVTASDNCDGDLTAKINYSQTVAGSGCSQVITRTWSVADSCGNTTTKQQIITIVPLGHNCTYTIGYYKNHPSAIAPLPVYLGNPGGPKTLKVTTQQQGVDVLSQKVYCSPSDGITKLYAQLLAAKLNIANGADGTAVANVITAADSFLATHNCNDWSSLGGPLAAQVLVWQCALDSYNNGNIGPGHCGDSTCSSGGSSGGDDGSDNGGSGSHDNSGGSQGNDNSGGKGCKTGGH